MRATYVNGPELLTPLGNWIASRLPHVDSAHGLWGGEGRTFRIFGLRPLYRFCIVDFTKARFYRDKPAWVRLRVFGITVYERNRGFSGIRK